MTWFNSIIIGFILVLIVLMFFMGVTNAFFCCIIGTTEYVRSLSLFAGGRSSLLERHVTLNFIVLFGLLFGLGIIVMMLSL
jgi:hypothetical protein